MSPAEANLQAPLYPWSPDGDAAANFAIYNLRENLLSWVAHEGRIHCETLMCVLGSLAGFSALNAVLEEYVKQKKPIPENGFLEVSTNSGEKFYFGDLLNAYIVPQPGGTQHTLWAYVAGALVAGGVDQQDLPDVNPLFQKAAETVGSVEFGFLDVPDEHQPHIPPKTVLELFWMPTVGIFTYEKDFGPGHSKNVDPLYWPILIAMAVHTFIGQTKDIIPPVLAGKIVMESAIIASKYDGAQIAFRQAELNFAE